MNLPKPKKINAEKYVAGLSLFKRKQQRLNFQLTDPHWALVQEQ